MATTWSFAIDDASSATDVIAEATAEANRLGRTIVGEPSLLEAIDAEGRTRWWVSVYVERVPGTSVG